MHKPGGLDGVGFSAVLLVAAVIATFAARTVAVCAALVALTIDGGVRGSLLDGNVLRAIAQHAILLCGFVALNAVALRG
ncbi:hypothetical protein WFJ45_22810, partial [Salmonella enterica subsp. enterica serovar Minnesota]|uniref:hypothetical protein n=1 Tax=Salmonella enterica TaxID=28901 RepID=UPI003D2B0D7E